ncbi:MAG: hypothetical protein WDM70_01055 [Nitrosomonadales bacterium]
MTTDKWQGRERTPCRGGEMVYLPLKASSGMIGVLALLPLNPARIALPEQQRLLETLHQPDRAGFGAGETGGGSTHCPG